MVSVKASGKDVAASGNEASPRTTRVLLPSCASLLCVIACPDGACLKAVPGLARVSRAIVQPPWGNWPLGPRMGSASARVSRTARLLRAVLTSCLGMERPAAADALALTRRPSMCRWAENGSNLVRMKPWLYRLADEDNAAVQAVFGTAARHRAVEAVLTASRNVGRPGAADYDLLHSTLSAVWGGPVTGESVGGSSGRSGEPVRAVFCVICAVIYPDLDDFWNALSDA